MLLIAQVNPQTLVSILMPQPLKFWHWQVQMPKPGSQHFTLNLTVFPYLRIWTLSNKLEGIWCLSVCEATNYVWACRNVHTRRTGLGWDPTAEEWLVFIIVTQCASKRKREKEGEMTLSENCLLGVPRLVCLEWRAVCPPLVSEWQRSSWYSEVQGKGQTRLGVQSPHSRDDRERVREKKEAQRIMSEKVQEGEQEAWKMWKPQPRGRSIVFTSRSGQLSWP